MGKKSDFGIVSEHNDRFLYFVANEEKADKHCNRTQF